MTEPRHGTALAEQRIRALLAELLASTRNLGAELVYSGAFRSDEWPRAQYALDRDDLDLYGTHVAVDFAARLRGMVRFESADALAEQMHRDVDEARDLLGGTS